MTIYADIVFPDNLDMRWLGGIPKEDGSGAYYNWTDYVLLHEFRCIWNDGIVTAFANFVCDRASIPQVGLSVIPKDGSWQRGSITHDLVFWEKGVPGVETFELANELLLASMIGHRNLGYPLVIETPFFQRNVIMAAVTGPAGRAAWDDDK